MRRIVVLMVLLTRATAHSASVVPSTTEAAESTTMPPPPTVFRNPHTVTGKPRRGGTRPGKADSPMLNYIFDSYATSNKHFHDMFKPPSFEDSKDADETVINADTGATVIFDCKVTSLRDKTVSWIRVSEDENLELLTVDLDTHTADARYKVDIAGENWKLALSDAKVHDSGIYCCHVSTHPPMLKRFKLIVHPPEIRMSKEAFLESGETLSLKCAVLNLHPGEIEPEMRWYKGNTSTPLDEVRGGVLVETDLLTLTSQLQQSYMMKCAVLNLHPGETEPEMRWYKGNTSTPLDEVRGGVLVETDLLTLTSQLQVARLKVEDAGNYTCALQAPLQMRAVARVHVLQGSSLAELQSGVKTTTSYRSLLLTSMVLLFSIRHGDIR